MKIIPKIVLFILIPGLLAIGSCKKSFFTDVNSNPNVLSSVTPTLLLTTVEGALGYTQAGDMSRFSALITQQMFGANSQSQSFYQYGYNPGSFDNLWPDYYTSTLENNFTLKNISDSGAYKRYAGISRIIMAYALQVGVDLWGDIPYSQSFKGNLEGNSAIFHPIYDKGQALYDTVTSLINSGTALLQDPNPGLLVPSGDDVIFGGDVASWIRFGHAIKARLAIHQSKNNVAMAATALAEIAQSFTKNSQGAFYRFAPSQSAANSWYQFYRDRPGDENFESSTLAASMTADSDPRFPAYDMDGSVSYYNQIGSPAELITYDELLFMSAEATLRSSGDIAAAQTFYKAAITANFLKLGLSQADADAYLTTHGTLPGTVNAAIAQVGSQEFTALFLNPEAWTTWRRTASPVLPIVNAGSAIPRRLLYPQTEINFNGDNVPKNVTLYLPAIFWDK